MHSLNIFDVYTCCRIVCIISLLLLSLLSIVYRCHSVYLSIHLLIGIRLHSFGVIIELLEATIYNSLVNKDLRFSLFGVYVCVYTHSQMCSCSFILFLVIQASLW